MSRRHEDVGGAGGGGAGGDGAGGDDVRLQLRGVPLTIRPPGVVRLDACDVLLVGDLHLGRATVMQRAGLALPVGSDEDDLERLADVIEGSGVERVVLLGDVVHAAAANGPALTRTLARLGRLPASVEAIPGNHDRRLREWLHGSGVRVRPARMRLGGVELTHRPRQRAAGTRSPLRIAAHLHPVATLGRGPGALRLPAVVVTEDEVVVPAFGATTGGTSVSADHGRRVFVATDTAVLDVPARPARTRRIP